MRRFLIFTSLLLAVLATGCSQAPPEPAPSAREAADAKRGKHRVRRSSRATSQKTSTVEEADIPILDMALLDVEESTIEVDRDPFRYGSVPRPKTAPVKRPPRPVPEPVPRDPEPAGPVTPTAPPFPHTYIGSFGSVGLRIAVFEDQEGTVVNAFEGEVMEGKFKVLKIGFESVDIEFVGFPDTPAERLEIGG